MLKKNDKINVEITDVTNLGYGVAHYDGETVFVRNTVTGDEVSANIIKKSAGYSVALPVEFNKISPHRIHNDCRVFPSCGGCAYRHMDYEYERDIKREYVASCFRKEGIDISVSPVAYTLTEGYRNKVQYPVSIGSNGRLFLGFYSEYSHRAVDSNGCKTEAPCFVGVKQAITELINTLGYTAYDEKSGKGLLRHVFLRCNFDGDVHVCFVVNAHDIIRREELVIGLTSRCTNVKGISVNVNTENTNVIFGDKTETIWGDSSLCDVMCGKRFSISPQSFWQINRNTAEALYEKGKELLALKSGEILLDLYCGIGSIGISIADKDVRLVGVEIVPEAVRDASENAVKNGFVNASFYCCDAAEGMEKCRRVMGGVDAVVVDPPRKGLSRDVIDDIASSEVKKVLYISCNPATLARDVRLLCDKGYTCSCVYPYDMFPRTGHIENILLLTCG